MSKIDKELEKNKIKSIRENLKYKKYDLAKQQIDECIMLFGEDCYIELEEARYYHEIRNYKEAKKILNNLIDNNSKNVGYALYELGRIYVDSNRYDKAIEVFKKIDETNHKSKSYAYFQIGTLYEKKSQFNEAIIYFEKVVALDKSMEESAKFHLARTYLYAREFEKSREIFNTIVPHNNDKLECLIAYYQTKIEYNIGSKKKYEEMVDDYLIMHPEFNALIAEKVKILLSKNKDREAEKYLKKIKRDNLVDSNNYDFLYAEYYEHINKYDKALEYYNKLITQPNIKKTLDIDRIITGIATCYIGIGKIDKGYEYFKKLYEKNNSYSNIALYNMISIDIYKGNYKKAQKLLNKIDPNFMYVESDIINFIDLKFILEKVRNIQVVREKEYSYRRRQIINYNEDLAYEHICEGHGYDENKKNEVMFSKDINIRLLMDEIKEKINEDTLVRINVLNSYKICYKNVGTFNDESLDYLVVTTLPFSKDIITMYPTDETLKEKIEVDVMKEEEKPKQKVYHRESQIEKFNRRYNLK